MENPGLPPSSAGDVTNVLTFSDLRFARDSAFIPMIAAKIETDAPNSETHVFRKVTRYSGKVTPFPSEVTNVSEFETLSNQFCIQMVAI
jgi:hypothetical protein